jgi:gliding motility-associated-like protein
VTITDAAGCSQNDTATIGAWNTLNASAVPSSPTCNASCDGWATVNVSSGTAPFTYQWSDPLGQNTATAMGLCAGTYMVAVSDASGCGTTSTVVLTQPSAITVNPAVTPTACNQCNGVITINAAGGVAPYSYLWSNGATSSGLSGVCAGVYSVIVTDATGCSNSFTVGVPASGGPTSSGLTSTNVTCFGAQDGSASVAPVGGIPPYSFLWIPGGQTTSSVSGLSAGTYYVQIADSAGCIFTDSVQITSPAQITANQLIVNTDCGISVGSITLNPSGGTGPYTYLWAPGGQTTTGITGLTAGIYTVTITDATGCSQTAAIPVSSANSTIVMNTTSGNVLCNGDCNGQGVVTVTAGNGPFTYQWSSGSTTDTANGLCPGAYIVQVTDVNGCVSSLGVNITEPTPIGASFPFVTAELCAGACDGSIMALPSGGTLPYSYVWSNAQTSQTAINLCSGSYSVTISDANGCTTTSSGTIISPNVLVLGAPVVTAALCNNSPDGAIDITVSGGATPYTFAWTGPGTFSAVTEDLTGVLAGSYTVLITDNNGCSTIDTVVIGALTSVIASAGPDTSACVAGQITLDGSNSINAVTYSWTWLPSGNNVGNSVVTIVTPLTGTNTYVLTVTNNGCTSTDTVLVNSLPQPFVDAGPDQSILAGTTTTIGGTPAGGPGVTYAWGPSTGLGDPTTGNPVAGPTASTSYTLVVTDSAGCTASDTMLLEVLPSIWFPDGFTPNGDGTNDTWVIDNIFLFPNCEIEVYDRWGLMLFRSVGYNTPWDGQYNGKDLPVGTYYYIIKLNDPMFTEVFTGPLTIMR